jgi:hypothetical protein
MSQKEFLERAGEIYRLDLTATKIRKDTLEQVNKIEGGALRRVLLYGGHSRGPLFREDLRLRDGFLEPHFAL